MFQKVLPDKSLAEIDQVLHEEPLLAIEAGLVPVHYLIALVQADDLARGATLLGRTGEIIKRSRGAIACVLPPIVLTTFGTPIHRDGTEERRMASVATELVQELGSDIKVMYGTADGYHGLVAIGSYMHFGPVLPKLPQRLQQLMSATFGTVTVADEGTLSAITGDGKLPGNGRP